MNNFNLTEALIKKLQMAEFDLNEFMMRPSDYDIPEYIGEVHLLIQSILTDLDLPPYTRYETFDAESLINEADRRGIYLSEEEAAHILENPSLHSTTVEDTIDDFIRINEF